MKKRLSLFGMVAGIIFLFSMTVNAQQHHHQNNWDGNQNGNYHQQESFHHHHSNGNHGGNRYYNGRQNGCGVVQQRNNCRANFYAPPRTIIVVRNVAPICQPRPRCGGW